MGLEAQCTATFDGKTSPGKAHLETDAVRFRGEFRLAIPLKSLQSVEASDGRLALTSSAGTAVLDLGPDAGKWAQKILNPRSLLDKLGVKGDSRVALVGPPEPEFVAELAGRLGADWQPSPVEAADLVFSFATTTEDLERLADLERRIPRASAVWVVTPRGVREVGEAAVMAAGKAAGLVDVKVARFSDTHTAAKLVVPVARR